MPVCIDLCNVLDEFLDAGPLPNPLIVPVPSCWSEGGGLLRFALAMRLNALGGSGIAGAEEDDAAFRVSMWLDAKSPISPALNLPWP